MAYAGRPGVSPVVASLIAVGEIRPEDRILDVGCGTGKEALLLAAWGCKAVVGIDLDARAIGVARGRATRRHLTERARFHVMDASELPARLPDERFDVVLHTLVANNLRDDEMAAHFEGIRAVMAPSGLLVVQERVVARDENAPPDHVPPIRELARLFDASPGVSTHLPERRHAPSAPDYARVVVWLARPRAD